MPRIPSYRLHKASGRAVVQFRPLFGTKRHYLPGDFNSPESRAAYEKLRQQIVAMMGVVDAPAQIPAKAFVGDLVGSFIKHAKQHYGGDKKEFGHYRTVGNMLLKNFGLLPCADFGPLRLQELREKMIDRGWCRNHVNRQTHRVRRIFKWGTAQQISPPAIYQALMAVEALLKGKTRAPETEAKRPADWATVERLLPFLLPCVRTMVEIQWLTGMRSDEICSMRDCDLEDAGDGAWLYEPKEHKTAWRGKRKVIAIGPRSMALLRPYLRETGFLFSPAVTMRQQAEIRKAGRKSKQYGQPKAPKERPCSDRYDAHSYQRAVNYGFVKLARSVALPQRPADVTPREWSKQWANKPKGASMSDWLASLGIAYWHPHQLRHSRATLARATYGLEGAQALLGNVANATERYAEKSLVLAVRIAQETG